MPSPLELKDQGLRFYRADQFPQAAEKFTQAAQAYAETGDEVTAAEMLNNLCVVRLAQQDWDAARAVVAGTPDIFRAHGDALREAQALANLAAAHDGAGQVEDAIPLYEKVIEIFGALNEQDNRAACYKKLSALQIKKGLQLQALASMHSGLNLSPELTAKEKTLKAMLDRAMKMIGK